MTDLIDVGRVLHHFAEGATIVLQGLHRYWPPVSELCERLSEELSHPVQANAYLTPPVAQGLNVHADSHDVFAVQTHGRKQWVVYEGDVRPGPDGSGAEPTMDIELLTGDCLYLPRGTHHAARTVDAPSLHLTIGVPAVTWRDVLSRALSGLLEDEALDTALPAGFARSTGEVGTEAARRLEKVLAGAAAEAGRLATEAVERAAERVRTGRPPRLRGQLAQLLAIDAIDDDTPVRPRPGLAARITADDGHVMLSLPDRALRLPTVARPALERLLSADSAVPVAAIAEHLDEPGRLALVRRLVREGVLVTLDG